MTQEQQKQLEDAKSLYQEYIKLGVMTPEESTVLLLSLDEYYSTGDINSFKKFFP